MHIVFDYQIFSLQQYGGISRYFLELAHNLPLADPDLMPTDSLSAEHGVYREMKEAFEKKDMERCRELQHQSHRFIEILGKYRGNLMGGKRMMKFLGLDCGPNRLPLQNISDAEEAAMKKELEAIGFFSYCNQ